MSFFIWCSPNTAHNNSPKSSKERNREGLKNETHASMMMGMVFFFSSRHELKAKQLIVSLFEALDPVWDKARAYCVFLHFPNIILGMLSLSLSLSLSLFLSSLSLKFAFCVDHHFTVVGSTSFDFFFGWGSIRFLLYLALYFGCKLWFWVTFHCFLCGFSIFFLSIQRDIWFKRLKNMIASSCSLMGFFPWFPFSEI